MPKPSKDIRHSGIVDALAERVQTLRKARELSRPQLADLLNTSLSYVARLETGGVAPGIDMVERVAKALGVHITELLPTVPHAEDTDREQVKGLFATLINKAGRKTLHWMKELLEHCNESPASKR